MLFKVQDQESRASSKINCKSQTQESNSRFKFKVKRINKMTEKKYDLEDRLVEFAGNIVFFCKDLPND